LEEPDGPAVSAFRHVIAKVKHHKTLYSLPGFEPRTYGFVVWTSDR
jgi:hypothetical protein